MSNVQAINITNATPAHRDAIVALLREAKLPTEDLPHSLHQFLVATDKNDVVATIGLELHGEYGLLRSMVVHPNQRNHGIASRLVEALELHAQLQGLTSMYLLTETAADYFEKKGYERTTRERVPEAIKASSEFSSVCPVSAIVMKKPLAGS